MTTTKNTENQPHKPQNQKPQPPPKKNPQKTWQPSPAGIHSFRGGDVSRSNLGFAALDLRLL